MKTLLKFSFKRRFLNKMTIFLQIMFIGVVMLVFYFDKVSEFLNLDLNEPIPIYIETNLRKSIVNEAEWEQKGFKFTEGPAVDKEGRSGRCATLHPG